MEKIRLLLVDDHKLLTDAWTQLFNSDPRFNVIAVANRGDEAIPLIEKFHPHIAIVDIAMTPIDGFELTRQIGLIFPAIKVIGLSIYRMKVYLQRMLAAGARGYVTKNSSKEELFAAVCKVNSGFTYICRDVFDDSDYEPFGKAESVDKAVNRLTRKELDIITFLKQGLSSHQIADRIKVSRKTVEVHRYNIMKKLHVNNVATLVNMANSRGL
ncbi:MAG: response regulator [Chitinophagaceae bacterium]